MLNFFLFDVRTTSEKPFITFSIAFYSKTKMLSYITQIKTKKEENSINI